LGIVVTHSHIQAVSEQGRIDTQVKLPVFFPFEVGVGHVGPDDTGYALIRLAGVVILAVVGGEAAVAGQPIIRLDVQRVDTFDRREQGGIFRHQRESQRGEKTKPGCIGTGG